MRAFDFPQLWWTALLCNVFFLQGMGVKNCAKSMQESHVFSARMAQEISDAPG